MTIKEVVRGTLLGGAISSVGITLYASRNNTHTLLSLIFVVWVLAPFVLLAFAEAKSSHWPPAMQRTLHAVAIIVTVATLVLFVNRIYHPPRAQAAFVFIVLPPASILFAVALLGVARLMAPKGQG